VVNPIALVVSASPAVARRSAGDLALTGWIETASAAATDMRLATVSNHAFPGVDALYTFPSLSSPTSVDLAISDDTVALVAWSALSEDGQVEVYAQLFDMTLEPESDVIRLTTGAAESTLPRVAASGGRFMVVWQEGPGNVGVAVVSAGGTVEVPAFAAITGDAVRPVVAPDLGGGFALAYEASVGAVVARLSGGGVPDLEALAMPGGHRPELTAIPDGGLVVAYESGGDVYLARLGCTP
jgi:hypothetical protein